MTASPHDHNRRAWDERAHRRQTFARPAKDEEFEGDPLKAMDPRGWMGGSVVGKRMMCLGAGGGRQGPLYAHAGAVVTVVDLSEAQLEIDRRVAAERSLRIRTVRASMDDLSMFADASFDVVVQPVSSCYIPDVTPMFTHVARVLIDGGLYISQHKQPASLQADVRPSRHGYELIEPYYRTGPLPQVTGSKHREDGTLEYLHRWEQLVGGMCRAGFVIDDLTEPYHVKPNAEPGSFEDRSRFVAPYVRIKAVRRPRESRTTSVLVG